MSDNVFGMDLEDDSPATAPSPAATTPEVPASDPPPADETPAEAPAPETPAPPSEEAADEDDEASYLATDGQGVTLGNKTYKDWQGADHVFRQFQGRAKAADRRAKEAVERAERAEQLLQASLENRAQAPTAAQPVADPAPEPRRIADALPTEDEIDAMISERGPAAAMRALLEQTLERAVPAVVDERTGDVQRIARVERAMNAAEELFDSVAATEQFPELLAEDTAQEVVNIWYNEVANDPVLSQLALTEHGIQIALDRFNARYAPDSNPPQPAPAVPRIVAQVKAQASAQRGLADMSDRAAGRPAPGPTVRHTEAELEEAARLAMASKRHEVFGFEAE